MTSGWTHLNGSLLPPQDPSPHRAARPSRPRRAGRRLGGASAGAATVAVLIAVAVAVIAAVDRLAGSSPAGLAGSLVLVVAVLVTAERVGRRGRGRAA